MLQFLQNQPTPFSHVQGQQQSPWWSNLNQGSQVASPPASSSWQDIQKTAGEGWTPPGYKQRQAEMLAAGNRLQELTPYDSTPLQNFMGTQAMDAIMNKGGVFTPDNPYEGAPSWALEELGIDPNSWQPESVNLLDLPDANAALRAATPFSDETLALNDVLIKGDPNWVNPSYGASPTTEGDWTRYGSGIPGIRGYREALDYWKDHSAEWAPMLEEWRRGGNHADGVGQHGKSTFDFLDWAAREQQREITRAKEGGFFDGLLGNLLGPIGGLIAGPIGAAIGGGLGGGLVNKGGVLGGLLGAAGGFVGAGGLSGKPLFGGVLGNTGGGSFNTFNSYFSPDPYTNINWGPVSGGVTLPSTIAGNTLNEVFPGLFPQGTPYTDAGTGYLGLGSNTPLAGYPNPFPIGGPGGGGFQIPDWGTGSSIPDPSPDPQPTGGGGIPLPPVDLTGDNPDPTETGDSPPEDPLPPLPIPIPGGGGGGGSDLPDLPQPTATGNYDITGTMGWDSRFQEKAQNPLPGVPKYFTQFMPMNPAEMLQQTQQMLFDPFEYRKYMVNPYA